MLKRLRNEKGFTMVEMMVVLIIIAVLVGGGMKFYTGYINKAKVSKAAADISSIQAALDSYYVEKSAYPTSAYIATHMSEAGLSESAVTTHESDTISPYKYYCTNDTKYFVYTRTTIGDKYVVGYGTDGTSQTPITTGSTTW